MWKDGHNGSPDNAKVRTYQIELREHNKKAKILHRRKLFPMSAKPKKSGIKNIPVILLTNLGQKDDVEKGLQMGAVDYLIKAHFKPSEVVDKIKTVLHI